MKYKYFVSFIVDYPLGGSETGNSEIRRDERIDSIRDILEIEEELLEIHNTEQIFQGLDCTITFWKAF